MAISTILVTGGAGFIGSHLCAYLCHHGHSVVVLDDLSFGNIRNLQHLQVKVEFINGSVADPTVLNRLRDRRFSFIYHLAAQANVPMSVKKPVADFEDNLRGTLNVLEFAREQMAGVLFTSSVCVCAKDSPKPITERAPVCASSPYGAAKVGGENYCYAYANCYGLRTVVARLFNVYGPLMAKYVIHDFVHKLRANPKALTIIGSGEQVRDYTYVEDAVRAFVLLAERGKAGVPYNLGSGIPVRIRDLAQMIISQLGLGNTELICNNQEVVGDIAEWYADTSLLRSLGYEPQVPFQEGLRRTVQFILENS